MKAPFLRVGKRKDEPSIYGLVDDETVELDRRIWHHVILSESILLSRCNCNSIQKAIL